jgi:hypothetical protein
VRIEAIEWDTSEMGGGRGLGYVEDIQQVHNAVEAAFGNVE